MAAVVFFLFIFIGGIGLAATLKYDSNSENKFWLSFVATVFFLAAAFLWVYFLWAALFFALATVFYVFKSGADSWHRYTNKDLDA
jgi:hypothetical protein